MLEECVALWLGRRLSSFSVALSMALTTRHVTLFRLTDDTNMKFGLEQGRIVSAMNGQCVMPQSDSTLALQNDCSAGSFSYNDQSGELAFTTSGGKKLCTSVAVSS